jgi:hypothetical protein
VTVLWHHAGFSSFYFFSIIIKLFKLFFGEVTVSYGDLLSSSGKIQHLSRKLKGTVARLFQVFIF